MRSPRTRDFSFTATVEVLPELDIKDYTGLKLTRDSSVVTAEEDPGERTEGPAGPAVRSFVPVSSGLVGADGKASSRPVLKADHVDMIFNGALITENGREEKAGMSGNRVLEVGAEQMIPGFEDELVGMRMGETKTFRLPFPADFFDKDMAGKLAEFTVTINDVKEKKTPALDDELARQLNYESLADLRAKAQEHLNRQKTEQVDGKLRADLVEMILGKNTFDVPRALIENQTRSLAQDWANELKRQGVNDQTIQQAIMHEIEGLRKKRAEAQIRASLVLEAIAKKENIEVEPAEMDQELITQAANMKADEAKVREYYTGDPRAEMADLLFRLRQEADDQVLARQGFDHIGLTVKIARVGEFDSVAM